jgi:hypothetical protein
MKIHFAASNHDLDAHLPDYLKIISTIEKLGHSLTREWLDSDRARQQQKHDYSQEEYRGIWQEVKRSMLASDVVILEATQNSYSVGYQTAFALSNKKPVLVLTRNTHISKTIIAGEDNPLLSIVVYTDQTLAKNIEAFLAKYNVTKQDLRFNMMLDRETQMYLEVESYQSGKTKARIIRDILKREMKDKNGL